MTALEARRADTYQLHDWSIRSEVALAACTMPHTAEVDLQVVLGAPRCVPAVAPAGLPLALLDEPQGVALCQTASGHTLRFFGVCDFDLDETTRLLTIHLDPKADPAIAELLLTSSALSFLLELQGHCVIHASAVVLRGRAAAFIGPSACGKSSLAAALCAQGAPLLSDDVLRCYTSPVARCTRGSLALRLRPESSELARLFSKVTPSIDERTVVHAAPARDATYPLAVLLAPEPGDTLNLDRCSGVAAVTTVLKAARVTSWCSAEHAGRQFVALATLTRSVPVYRLRLPAEFVLAEHGRRALYHELERVLSGANGS